MVCPDMEINQILPRVMESSFTLIQTLYGGFLSETAVYHVAFISLMVSIAISAVAMFLLLRKGWRESFMRIWIQHLLTRGCDKIRSRKSR